MDGDSLAGRRRALHDAFYRDDDSLVEQLRLALREAAAKDDLAAASGITDPALLDELAGLGIRADTLAALTLIPLIQIAWADGVMDESERRAILEGATSTGLPADGPSAALLRIWIEDPPPPDLAVVWADFIRGLCASLDSEERTHLCDTLLSLARSVANASGEIGPDGTAVSPAERAVLEELAATFS